MKNINELYTEVRTDAYEDFFDQIDYVDPSESLYDAVGESVAEYIDSSVIETGDVMSVIAQQNSFFEDRSLKEEFLNELQNSGFADKLVNEDYVRESDLEFVDFTDTLEAMREDNMSFKELPNEELGKVAALFYDYNKENEVAQKVLSDAFINFEDQIVEGVKDELAYQNSVHEDITVEELLNGEVKGLDDLIADVEIEDKGEKESKGREIEER